MNEGNKTPSTEKVAPSNKKEEYSQPKTTEPLVSSSNLETIESKKTNIIEATNSPKVAPSKKEEYPPQKTTETIANSSKSDTIKPKRQNKKSTNTHVMQISKKKETIVINDDSPKQNQDVIDLCFSPQDSTVAISTEKKGTFLPFFLIVVMD